MELSQRDMLEYMPRYMQIAKAVVAHFSRGM